MVVRDVAVLLGIGVVGLVALVLSPVAAAVLGGFLITVGFAVRARGDRATGTGIVASGGALLLIALLLVVLVDAGQDKPVILGPDTGMTPGS